MATHPDPEDLRPRLRAHGIHVEAIEVVSSNEDRFEVVHEVTDRDGDTWYVQTLEPESADRYRAFADADVGMDVPAFEVLPGDPPLLVVESATGRPLSVVLPVALLPVVWSLEGEDVRRGVRSLGRNLGRLHAATRSGEEPYGDSDVDAEKIADIRAEVGTYGFDPDVGERIDGLLESLLSTEVTHAMTHRDPSPHNVFYADGEVELIDLDLNVRPAVVDVALADVGLHLMTARLPYGRDSQATALRGALREGYDETGVDVSFESETYRLVRIAQLCELLGNYARGETYSLSGRLTAAVDPPRIRSLVREEYAELR